MHGISVKPTTLFEIAGFPVTNAMLLGMFGMAFLIGWLLYVAHKVRHDRDGVGKKGFFTRLALWCFEGLRRTIYDVIPSKKIARQVTPFAVTIFFIVAIQYYTGVLPFAGEAILLNGHGVFRSQAADLNFTVALAIITIVAVQVWAVSVLGNKGNLGRYLVNPIKDPIGSFSGLLEIVAEFSRLIALAMRLFGNVFAGEVLLIVVAYLTQYASVVALPFFYIFELFIGGIQAYVFFMLATVFIGLAVQHGGHSDKDHSVEAKKVSEMTT
mgnify:CR=1 FL=1